MTCYPFFVVWNRELKPSFACCYLIWGESNINYPKKKWTQNDIFFFKGRFSTKTDHFQCFRHILNFDDFQFDAISREFTENSRCLGKKNTEVLGEPGEKADFFDDLNLQTWMYSFFSESDVCRRCMSYDLI